MRRGPGADADDALIGRIRRSSLLLNTHLRDMLTLAKGEAGRLEMRPEPFDACALVESVAASAADLASDKKLELIVDVPGTPTFVVADGARIDQILTNLVINSIRCTETGQVRLGLARYDPAEHLLRFTVSDTGPGIPAAMLPTLLTPDRVVTGSERRGEGSGIGLAIVRTLVDQPGGHVAVQSQVGNGTTFTVDIPAEPVESDDSDEARDAPTGHALHRNERRRGERRRPASLRRVPGQADRSRRAAPRLARLGLRRAPEPARTVDRGGLIVPAATPPERAARPETIGRSLQETPCPPLALP